MTDFAEFSFGEVFPRIKCVSSQTRNGIYHRNSYLISLLTDFDRINPCYPDTQGETSDSIFYTGNGRHDETQERMVWKFMLSRSAERLDL